MVCIPMRAVMLQTSHLDSPFLRSFSLQLLLYNIRNITELLVIFLTYSDPFY